ncbi:competence protein CoiA family protein [Hydrogenophaga sp. XSHU_21]
MSSILIMAIDASGAIRFVGDVLRGAACGCFCPMCKSPLVAKQGKENEWHFSHEASQERPECEAGAENLARSLGIEFARELAERRSLVLPEYRTSAGVISAWLDRSQAVEWNAQISGPLAWREHPPKSKVVATGALDTGAAFALFVQVGDAGAPQVDDLPEHCAYGSLVVSAAWPPGTRTREDAMAILKQTVSFRWGYLVILLLIYGASRLDLRFASALFAMCLLASAAVLVYALIVANGMGVYLQAIPAFAEDLSTFSPSRVVAISLAVGLLVCTGADYQQFVLAARSPLAAVGGCVLAGLLLFVIAFLPSAVVVAMQGGGMLGDLVDTALNLGSQYARHPDQ